MRVLLFTVLFLATASSVKLCTCLCGPSSAASAVRVVEVASCEACVRVSNGACETVLPCASDKEKSAFCSDDPGPWANAEMQLPPAAVFGTTECDATSCCCPKPNTKVTIKIETDDVNSTTTSRSTTPTTTATAQPTTTEAPAQNTTQAPDSTTTTAATANITAMPTTTTTAATTAAISTTAANITAMPTTTTGSTSAATTSSNGTAAPLKRSARSELRLVPKRITIKGDFEGGGKDCSAYTDGVVVTGTAGDSGDTFMQGQNAERGMFTILRISPSSFVIFNGDDACAYRAQKVTSRVALVVGIVFAVFAAIAITIVVIVVIVKRRKRRQYATL